MHTYPSYLKELESEAIFVIREVFSQFENIGLLFSGGKDSIVLTHLAKKALFPARVPFPLIHIDTEHNFVETIQFRNHFVKEMDIRLVVRSVQNTIDEGRVQEEKGKNSNRNILQTTTLLDTIEEFKYDALLGGARRDEEKSRAKERFFSHRDEFGQWTPKNQRPELWSLFNGEKHSGEHFRVFPISNWTEKDIWNYIKYENIQLPSLYFAHKRKVIWRNNAWLPYSEFIHIENDEKVEEKNVRFRTLGDITITGGIESKADTVDKILIELEESNTSERGNRVDDQRSDSAMEDRKKEGYF